MDVTSSMSKKARVRLRQSEVFFPLAYPAIVANPVVQQGIFLVLSRISKISVRSCCAIDISDKVWRMSNSKDRRRRNNRIRDNRIQSSHFKFRRHGQAGEFLFRIRPPACKRQKQSGTKTFRIRHKSGTISSSVNLVLIAGFNKYNWTEFKKLPCCE